MKDRRELAKALGLVASLGLIVAVNIYLGFLLGQFLKVKTGNILFLALGLFAGVFSGAYSAYQLLKPFLDKKG